MHLALALLLLAADGGPLTIDEGEVAMRAGRFAEALHIGQALLAASSSSTDELLRARRVVGVAEIGLAEAGSATAPAQYAEAVQQLTPYHAAHPTELFVQAKLGEAYLRTGATNEGLALVEPLIADSAIPDAHVWEALAQGQQKVGNASGARVSAKACLRLDDANEGCKAVLAAVGPGSSRSKKNR